jgi:predicted short-subunit dehydrogenase-like oxidoreductase (DUF2520 family)
MKVVFIGAGNVATHLATELYRQKTDIVQVYSRTIKSAQELAIKVKATPITDINAVITNADLYIFSVKDSVLSDLIGQMPKTSGVWIHTAGSIPADIFENYIPDYGVLYPFQTFTKGRIIGWEEIPIFIEASNKESLDTIMSVAKQLSNKVYELSSDKRKYIHLTGVFACNFSNHMYTLSKTVLEKVGLPFEIALPLIDETCAKIHELSPVDAQTGPAVRYDENVINKHLELIEDDQIKEIYKLISKNIYDIHQKNDKP